MNKRDKSEAAYLAIRRKKYKMRFDNSLLTRDELALRQWCARLEWFRQQRYEVEVQFRQRPLWFDVLGWVIGENREWRTTMIDVAERKGHLADPKIAKMKIAYSKLTHRPYLRLKMDEGAETRLRIWISMIRATMKGKPK